MMMSEKDGESGDRAGCASVLEGKLLSPKSFFFSVFVASIGPSVVRTDENRLENDT